MAIRDGLGANVRIGGDATANTVASLQSINFPAGVTQIDLTTVDDAVSGYQKSRRGLKTGSFTFTCLYDTANTALLAAVADGSVQEVYARVNLNDPTPFLAWNATLSADIQTGGVASAVTMTVTVNRESDIA